MRYTAEQLRAIETREGDLLLAANAGSGKTSVLTERYARGVLEDGVAPGAILAISFTEKAAGELADRVRRRLRAPGNEHLARAAEAGWIDTFHGVCARVLRAHPLAAGLDPRFAVLDEVAAARLEREAFDAVVGEDDVPLVAAYNRERLWLAITRVHALLRSRGDAPVLPPPGELPDVAAAAGRTVEAARAAGAEVTSAAGLEALDACTTLLAEPDSLPHPDAFDRLDAYKGTKGEPSAARLEYDAARRAWEQACLDARALPLWAALGDLLERHAAAYAARKQARSALDFSDLELRARDLLTDAPGLARAYAERFDLVMVDEFQDTNPLQMQLLGLVTRGNLFTVGDEFQSIYGFRHADVTLFRERRAALRPAGRVQTLATNFRTRREILDTVNAAFAPVLGDEFVPLDAGRTDVPQDPGPHVELLLSDRSADWDDVLSAPGEPPPDQAWRVAEARLLAQRVRELVAGGRKAGDVVVLLRATGDLGTFERALAERGLPTYVIGGRGYWAQREVQDLVAWLAVLANPRESLRLYEALVSPLAGVSPDALVALAAAARESGTDPWTVLQDAAPGPLDLLGDADRGALARFGAWAAGERRAAPRLGIEDLLERALARSGYDLSLLAGPGGERRLANVRKLMRLARGWEEAEGPDLRGFLDLVAERTGDEAAESREGEAPIESEDLDAVRLMTVHRAKGLEFPVVCVADLGRQRAGGDDEVIRVGREGEAGLRVVIPGASKSRPALGYAALGDARRAAEDEEERRLFYVAATRARDRLVLSGSASFSRWPSPSPACGPISWLAPALVPDVAARARAVADGGDATGVAAPEGGGARGEVAWALNAPATVGTVLREPVPAARDAGAEPAGSSRPLRRPPEEPTPAAAPVAAVPAPAVDRLSFSSLEAYDRCGYRFYLERVLRLPRHDDDADDRQGAGRPEEGRLPATTRGEIVHALLEDLDFARPAPPRARDVDAAVQRAGAGPLTGEQRDDLAGYVGAFARSPLCTELAAARAVRREEPFTFRHGGLLVTGVLDAAADTGGRTLVVDYKTNALRGRAPAAVVDDGYATQRLVYALAALRAGADEVEVAFCFLERSEDPVRAHFKADDEARLERELHARVAGITAGAFAPSASPDAELCAGCPGRGTLCSWPADVTRREPAGATR
jgi:ATP-dependent helicase/nuclease subunit A